MGKIVPPQRTEDDINVGRGKKMEKGQKKRLTKKTGRFVENSKKTVNEKTGSFVHEKKPGKLKNG